MTTNTPGRAAYTAGLRALAEALDTHPDIPLPFDGRTMAVDIFFDGDHARRALDAAVAVFPPQRTEIDANRSFDLTIHTSVGGLKLTFRADAEDVCQRRVTGCHRIADQVHEVVEWTVPDHLQPVPPTATTRGETD